MPSTSTRVLSLLVVLLVVADAASSPADRLEVERLKSLPMTVFGSDGRLSKVEHHAAASSDVRDASSPLVLALRCRHDDEERDFLVVLSTRPTSPYLRTEEDEERHNTTHQDGRYYAPLLHDHTTTTLGLAPPLALLGRSLLGGVGGNVVGSTILLRRMRETALSLQRDNDHHPSADHGNGVLTSVLARRLADAAQTATQTTGARPVMSSCVVAGADHRSALLPDAHRPELRIWRVDPTGQFWDCDAAAVGRGAGRAEALLLRRVAVWKRGDDGDDAVREGALPVTNDDVTDWLGTMDVEEAIASACDVVSETLGATADDKERRRFRGLQCAVLDNAPLLDDRRPRAFQILDEEALRKRVNAWSDNKDATTTTTTVTSI